MTRSVGRTPAEEESSERRGYGNQSHRPDERRGQRMFHGPRSVGGHRVGVAEEVPNRGRDRAHRVPVGNDPQPARHVEGRHQGVGHEREREYDDKAHRHGRFGLFGEETEAGGGPGEGVTEEERDAKAPEHRPDVVPRAPADGEPDSRHDCGTHRRREQVGDRAPDESRGSPHGECPEALDDAVRQVGGEADAGAHRGGDEVHREQASEDEVRVAGAAGERHPRAEHVYEEHREQDRLNGHVRKLHGLTEDMDEVAPRHHHYVLGARRQG